MSNRFKIIPALLIVSMFQGCVLFNMNRASLKKSFTVLHVPESSLSVSSRNGSIDVIADPDLDVVVIDATFTCGGSTMFEAEERVSEATLIIERTTSRTLTIRPEFPGGPRNGDGARIVVHLPDADGVEISTGNGRVVVLGLAGPLLIETSNGRVRVEDHSGEAQIQTSNGRVTILRHGGPVEARTSNGKIILSLTNDVSEPFFLRSSNGSITVTVGSSFNGRVSFDTSNGRVRVRGDDDRITRERLRKRSGYVVVGNDDGRESVIDTSNGSITFKIADSSQSRN